MTKHYQFCPETKSLENFLVNSLAANTLKLFDLVVTCKWFLS